MPDFDPQRPQAPSAPNRPNRLRTVLMVNWLRTAWIGVGLFFFVMVVVPGGLLIYQYSGLGDQHQTDLQQDVGPESVTCDERYLDKAGGCIPPKSPDDSIVCGGKSRELVIPSGTSSCLVAGDLPIADCDQILVSGGTWVASSNQCDQLDCKNNGGVWVAEITDCIPKADCKDGGVWVVETLECIPNAKTVKCAEDDEYRIDDCVPYRQGAPGAPVHYCYAYYLAKDGYCVEPDPEDIRYPVEASPAARPWWQFWR